MANIIPIKQIKERVLFIRGYQVMIDGDLAELYGVETKVLNQAVKRNIGRFPEDFMFRLTLAEINELVTNCDRFVLRKHSSALPYVFTEQGVSMLSSVLRSERAINVNIAIMRVFVKIKEFAFTYGILEKKLNELEKRYNKHDKKIKNVFDTLNYLIRSEKNECKKKREIGFKCKA